MPTSTQREFTRVPVALEVEVFLEGQPPLRAHTQNLSMKGMMVLTGAKVSEGTSCEAAILLEGDIRIQARGKVARAYPEGFAVQFDALLGVESFQHLQSLVRYNTADLGQVEDELRTHLGIRKREADS